MVAQAITTARAAGVSGLITVRGDGAYGNRAVIRTCRRYGAVFSLVLTRNTAVQRAIDAIPEGAWTPVKYPGAVLDPDTGAWISDAEVAETTYTMAESDTEAITARLIVRRVKDATQPDGLFPIWRYHPFFTNSTEPATDADITHRRHAIIETTFADLIDGPWLTYLLDASAPIAHGRSARPSHITCCVRPRPWPAPATATPAAPPCADTWSTSPHAWPDPSANRSCTYPPTGPGNPPGSPCGTTSSATHNEPEHHHTTRQPGPHRKSWADQQLPRVHRHQNQDQRLNQSPRRPIGGLRLKIQLIDAA
ncbi:hypothetical protein MBOU_30910 [Mycobacterium bourgelatii]|uniref:Transposase n=1 Tax=Mycobacterium bourgelatii TaxID=1273442 RepID=A0A7I9YQU6_MYCBU|nr:hypothetical protein MBOU_30910 [Mycobacterium bourgelatii]